MTIKDGFEFAFDESGCSVCRGYCCSGESGYIWLSRSEIEAICHYLDMDTDSFLEQKCIKVGYKHSLAEFTDSEKGSCCIFFDTISSRCKIYEVRPKQCREFPFWDGFKHQRDKVFLECPYTLKL